MNCILNMRNQHFKQNNSVYCPFYNWNFILIQFNLHLFIRSVHFNVRLQNFATVQCDREMNNTSARKMHYCKFQKQSMPVM